MFILQGIPRGDVLFEKNQKEMSFSLAQRKELKETSTLTKLDFVDLCHDSG